jgi:hypothetical protein
VKPPKEPINPSTVLSLKIPKLEEDSQDQSSAFTLSEEVLSIHLLLQLPKDGRTDFHSFAGVFSQPGGEEPRSLSTLPLDRLRISPDCN